MSVIVVVLVVIIVVVIVVVAVVVVIVVVVVVVVVVAVVVDPVAVANVVLAKDAAVSVHGHIIRVRLPLIPISPCNRPFTNSFFSSLLITDKRKWLLFYEFLV